MIHQPSSIIAKYQVSGEAVAKLLAHPTEFPKICTPKAKNKIINHQALLRKKLLEIQGQKAKSTKVENEKKLKRVKYRKMKKDEQFHLVKSKVFEKRTPEYTEATLTSPIESLSLSSSDNSRPPTSGTIVCHNNYGRVPKYILRRKIEEGREASEVPPVIEYIRKISDVARIRNEYDNKIIALKNSLRSLPFGIQSSGSVKRREDLEGKLRQLQHDKSFITEKRFYNEQRIIQLNAKL
eukprot:scaffold1388_cov267-Chaetoceros_neogracile.AAC.30